MIINQMNGVIPLSVSDGTLVKIFSEVRSLVCHTRQSDVNTPCLKPQRTYILSSWLIGKVQVCKSFVEFVSLRKQEIRKLLKAPHAFFSWLIFISFKLSSTFSAMLPRKKGRKQLRMCNSVSVRSIDIAQRRVKFREH